MFVRNNSRISGNGHQNKEKKMKATMISYESIAYETDIKEIAPGVFAQTDGTILIGDGENGFRIERDEIPASTI